MGRARTLSLAVLASLLSHAGAMLLLSGLPSAPAPATRQAEFVAFSVAASAAQTAASAQPVQQVRPVVYGGPLTANTLDRDQREGQSGDGVPDDHGILLSAFASPVTLQDTDINNLQQNQAQRIDTAQDRATLEQRRATPNPSDQMFLASGQQGHRERRSPSHVDSAPGAPTRASASEFGAAPDARRAAALEDLTPSDPGGAQTRPAPGIARGRGVRQSSRARVAFARPNIDRGKSATTAEAEDSAVRDDVNAELLAAKLQRSIIDASLARGDKNLQGHAGSDAARTGSARGDDGDGSKALPYTPGKGHDGALDTKDGRYVRWFVEQKARVESGLVFPFARAIRKDQGTSLYRVILTRSGSLLGQPTLIRSSGFADFDAAARAAIRKAAPFPPLPRELMQDRDALTLLIPIVFENPMVE